MIRVSVLYPAKDGATFDHDYYLRKHMPMVEERLRGFGLRRWEVDRGIGPGGAPPFVAVGHLYFDALADFEAGMSAHGKGLMADVPNYTTIQPVVQVAEIRT
jgi:uncharacterized protein (TIGR02118 family)